MEPSIITKNIGKVMDESGNWHDFKHDFAGNTAEQAEELYKDWHRSCYGFDVNLPLGILLEKYLYEILIPDNSIRYNTKAEYFQAYRKHIKSRPILQKPLCDVRAIDLQMEYNSMECGKKNIKIFNILLSRLYAFLQLQMELVDPTRILQVPKEPKNPNQDVEVWSDDELETILSGLPSAPRIRFLIVMLMNTGCRISELLALKYTDISGNMLSINKQLIKVKDLHNVSQKSHYRLDPPKSANSYRKIPLNGHVMSEFEIHKEWHRGQMKRCGYKTDFIFTTRSGHVIDKRSEMRTFNRFYDRIGVPHRSYHVYRHTFATQLCRANVPLEVASELLGHSSVNVTAKYYINIGDDQKIEAINKLLPINHIHAGGK